MDTTDFVFSWFDYSLFFAMLIVSALVGVYFAFFGKSKQNNRAEYMYGGKSMSIFPIAASLIASDISGLMLLAVPTDIYLYGCTYWLSCISTVVTCIIVTYVFLPVFYKTQVRSSFEYLKLRFDNSVCVFASFIFSLTANLYLPICVYIPALAFSQVTGMNLNYIIPLVCTVCIFYTTLGGLKAVVWTDAIQMVMMIGSVIAVFVLGVVDEGGFASIWNKSMDGGRIDFNLDPDITKRNSSFAIVIGLTVMNLGFSNNPGSIQRFLSLPKLSDAKKALLIYCIGIIFFKTFCSFLGLIMYSKFSDCDPVTSSLVEKPDQILPLYVTYVARAIPGLAGLFIAGIFCAALSTLSSCFNTMAGTIYEDFIAAHMSPDTSEKRASTIMKIICVVLGVFCTVLVFAVQYMGQIFQLTMLLGSIASGPLLGMFCLGFLAPSVNAKGIKYGCAAGMLVVGWMIAGTQYYVMTGQIPSQVLPLNTEGCDYAFNATAPELPKSHPDDLPSIIYRINFFYFSLIGVLVTTAVALPVSWFSGGLHQKIQKDLLSPVLHPWIPEKYILKENVTEKELESLNTIN